MSAPYCLMTSCGAVVLPSDLLIFLPSPSRVKPCVNTLLYGAKPLVAQLSSSEEWNQPRCWSEPSRYIEAGKLNHGHFCLLRSTQACVVPLSNQTSRISSTLRHWPACSTPSRKRSRAPGLNQASAPSSSNAWAIRWLTVSLVRISPFSLTNTAIGTPQARWRDSTQSDRSSIIERSRFCPAGG